MTDADPKNGLSSRSAGDSPVLAWARRRAPTAVPGNTVSDLLAGRNDSDIATRRGLPLATVMGVRSFYDQIEPGPRVCDGTACHFEGGRTLEAHLARCGPLGAVRCLGHCYGAPAFQTGAAVFARPRDESLESWLAGWGEDGSPAPDLLPIPRHSLAEVPVVLRHLLRGAATQTFDEYELPDGEAILRALEAAHLRGRGGASYPTAAKWRAARDTPADERFVVANGDEGDPGSFVDRLLLEEDPHAVLAGMVACARVIGARRGIVYIRAEYPRAQLVMRRSHSRGPRGRRARRRLRGRGRPGRRLVRLRRGDRAAPLDRGTARRAAPQAALSRAVRTPWSPDRGAERRDAGDRAVDRSPRAADRTPRRCQPLGRAAAPGRGRGAARHAASPRARAGGWRAAARARAGAWRWSAADGPGRARARVRHAALVRSAAGHGARRGRRARRHRHSARARRAPVRVRARRVVRHLHAVPRGDARGSPTCATARRSSGCSRRSRPGACAASARACRARSATCSSTSATRCSHERAAWTTVRVAGATAPCSTPAARPGPRSPPSATTIGCRSGGHCRSCLVEVDGRMVAACSTPAREGVDGRHRQPSGCARTAATSAS